MRENIHTKLQSKEASVFPAPVRHRKMAILLTGTP